MHKPPCKDPNLVSREAFQMDIGNIISRWSTEGKVNRFVFITLIRIHSDQDSL